MSEDREQEREEGQKRPSRPVTAAARRERRGAPRPAARAAAEGRTTQPRQAAGAAGAKKGSADAEAKPKTASSAGEKKGRPTAPRDRKEKRPSPPARLLRFLREVVAELRKVIWPTRKQMVTYTAVVLVFVAFMVALIAGLDIALAKGVFWLFG